jgi:hypothetical protein
MRIGFIADPDPAFYLNADSDPDPDPDPGSQTRLCLHQKLYFDMKNILDLKKHFRMCPYILLCDGNLDTEGKQLVWAHAVS